MMKKFEADAGLILLVVIIMMVYLWLASGCATKCRKLCCPEVGHGPCPICNETDFMLTKIRDGKLVR